MSRMKHEVLVAMKVSSLSNFILLFSVFINVINKVQLILSISIFMFIMMAHNNDIGDDDGLIY